MTGLLRLLCLLALAGTISPAFAQQARVFGVEGEGNGYTFKASDGACLLMAPAHVLDSDALFIIGRQPGSAVRHGLARKRLDFSDAGAPMDLGVALVEGALSRDCGSFRFSAPRLDPVLSRTTRGAFTTLLADGSLAATPLEIIDIGPDYLVFVPVLADDAVSVGMSGSLVLLEGQPAGLVINVENGIATALRFDTALSRAIDGHETQPAPASPVFPSVVTWTSLPASVQAGPQAILDPSRAARFRDPELPLDLVIDLGAIQSVGEVRYAAPAGPCGAPGDGRILLATAGAPDGPWLQTASTIPLGAAGTLPVNRRTRYLQLTVTAGAALSCLDLGYVSVN